MKKEPQFPINIKFGYQEIKTLVGVVRRVLGKKPKVKHTWRDLRDDPTGRGGKQE